MDSKRILRGLGIGVGAGAALGMGTLAWSAGVEVRSPEGRAPSLFFTAVPEARSGKNRLHLDLIVGDRIEAEADRFIGLGATRVSDGPIEEGGTSWIVLADPEGNELCICLD